MLLFENLDVSGLKGVGRNIGCLEICLSKFVDFCLLDFEIVVVLGVVDLFVFVGLWEWMGGVEKK